MKRILLIGPLLLIWGCGQDDSIPSIEDTVQDQDLTPYLESFLSEAESRDITDLRELSRHLTLKFQVLALPNQPLSVPEVNGECVKGNGNFAILVDPNNWATPLMSGDGKTVLMYHELGHCLLGRGHITTMWTNSQISPNPQPKSIMYPSAQRVDLAFYNDTKFYIDELFANRRH